MTIAFKSTVAIGALIASSGLALADCGIESGSVRILSNDFPALQAVAAGAAACATDSVEVTSNLTTEHEVLAVPALTTDPATYTVKVVSNNSLVPLLTQNLIRPLDDLVAEYGDQLTEQNFIRVDGQIMAIAFMVNAQHAWYRTDLFEQAGLELPTTYEGVLEAAAAMREQGILENPIAANLRPGFDIAAEFVNMYIGLGGEFFEPGSAEPAIENETAVEALGILKAMTEYMDPDFLTFNTNASQQLWESGEVAFWNGWGSRAGGVLGEASNAPDIAAVTALGAAPTVGGTIPAGALWWDGFTIAANISEEDAVASFRAMMNGMAADNLLTEANAGLSPWIVEGYEATPAAEGVIATMEAGGRPFPGSAFMSLLFTALGDNLADYMQGNESAEQALADATAAYRTAATEAGFLQ